MRSQWIKVTPEKAREWLLKNKKNRTPRDSKVALYANDMKSGKWLESPQGIIFADNGDLIDGQHRLLAVCEANVPVQMYVTFDAPDECQPVLDLGLTRTVADILGWTHPNWKRASLRGAIAAQMFFGPRSQVAQTVTEKVDLANKYHAALNYIIKQFPAGIRGITTAPVLAAIGRVLMQHNVDVKRLDEFCEVMRTGMILSKDDEPAILLRNWLLTGTRRMLGGTAVNTSTYRKTQRALYAFMHRKPLTNLREIETDLFPISFCHKAANAS